MADSREEHKGRTITRRFLVYAALFLFLLCSVVAISLKLYLSSAHPAAQLSRLLTEYLRLPVSVSELRISGGGVQARNIALANPAGFPAGNLATLKSIVIAPDWTALLGGKRSFRQISLDGLRLDFGTNSSGEWNAARLRHLLQAKKPAPETFIRELAITDSQAIINGRTLQNVSLRIFNLATKGSSEATMGISFADIRGGEYLISGTALPGSAPSFAVSLESKSCTLQGLNSLVNAGKKLPVSGDGKFRIDVSFRGRKLAVNGQAGFRSLVFDTGAGLAPLECTLGIGALYDFDEDTVKLETLSFNMPELLNITATGMLAGLRTDRRYTARVTMDEVDLAMISLLLPEQSRKRTKIGGRIGSSNIRIAGNAAEGLSTLDGVLRLRDGSLVRDGRLICTALSATLAVATARDGLLAEGRMFIPENRKTLVEKLDAPLTVSLDRRLKVRSLKLPELSARVSGIPLSGRLVFIKDGLLPFSASLRVPDTSLNTLNPLLDGHGITFSGGTASLSMNAAGRSLKDCAGDLAVKAASVQGMKRGDPLGLGSGITDVSFTRSQAGITASGSARLTKAAFGEKRGDARSGFRYAGGMVDLDKPEFRMGTLSFSALRITAAVPVKEIAADLLRYPVAVDIKDAEIRQGDVGLSGVSGTMRGAYAADSRSRWLEGGGSISAGKVSLRGRAVGAPTVGLAFTREGGSGILGGTLLGGTLKGDIAFNPFSPLNESRFRLEVARGQFADVGSLMAGKGGVTGAGGLFDFSTSGSYAQSSGLVCRFEGKGDALSIAGQGGKSLLRDGGVITAGVFSGRKLTVSDIILTAGEGVTLKGKGEVDDFASAKRQAGFTFSLRRTPLNSLIDPFVNLLPRALQEATFDGAVAGDFRFGLDTERTMLDGAIELDGVRMDMSSQKFTLADLTGRVPFSFDLAKVAQVKHRSVSTVSRASFPDIFMSLSKPDVDASRVKIGRLSFGPLEFGETLLYLTAGEGKTEITSISSSLSGGTMRGRGFVTTNGGIAYGTDLLLDGLSLQQFCSLFPKIKGYLSGRLDGIVSVLGSGKGMSGVEGFTELWAREGGGEKMLVSKEFLQKLAGKNLRGFFFRDDRPYDRAEIKASLIDGYLEFETLDISHTNFIGIRDLSVSVAQAQNRIALEHLLDAIRQAAARGKAAAGEDSPAAAPVENEFRWQE